jgi:ABC-type nickel/cobalt efflux system permease component RcnA
MIITTSRTILAIIYRLAIFPAIFLWATLAFAHPFGGIDQKTVVSDFGSMFLIDYTTHFDNDQLVLLHPDRDNDGHLDEAEQQAFLGRVHDMLLPNLVCQLGQLKLQLNVMEQKIAYDDTKDFKKGIRTTFSLRVPIGRETALVDNVFSIRDNNFAASEKDQLNYYTTVLGKTAPMTLVGDGRELQIDLSGRFGAGSVNLPGQAATRKEQRKVQSANQHEEADSLIAFLQEGQAGIGLYLVGMFTAFILGALHALSPGHGKAMVAAYLVGTGGRVIDAVRLGIVVTITHVLAVIVLGILALALSHYTISKDFYPWLGLASGVLIIFTGYFLLVRMALDASISHHHHHDHGHDGHDPHEHHAHSHLQTGRSIQEILSLGIAGGLVPCPSAIVILLFAISINRIGTGLLLIVFFSLGLAGVLILIGILMVKASGTLTRAGNSVAWIKKIPVVTAGIIMTLGLGVGIKALIDGGILVVNL